MRTARLGPCPVVCIDRDLSSSHEDAEKRKGPAHVAVDPYPMGPRHHPRAREPSHGDLTICNRSGRAKIARKSCAKVLRVSSGAAHRPTEQAKPPRGDKPPGVVVKP